ncbi:MAG: hypothetical protein QNJ05_01280 [Woeseiaceae bacterium]|nr:hypothetical protein [Woeseiaceae bacterium]
MDVYQSVKDHFANDSRVTVNAGRGAQGIKVTVGNKEKMIIMFSKGDLLLQMPPASVDELVKNGKGLPYEVSPGRVMKDRIVVPASKNRSWQSLCERAITESKNL